MRVMGIDYGTKNVGIALSDEGRAFALPHTVLANTASLLDEVMSIIEEKDANLVVLGESRKLDGTPNEVQTAINTFKEALEEKGIQVVLEPEMYTSQEAARIQGETKTLDASAAALILRSYLDKQHD